MVVSQKFRCTLVDEAAQMNEVELLGTVNHSTKCLILVGDDKQLPPHTNSPYAKTVMFNRSTFDRLINSRQDRVIRLEEQYRMVPAIAQVTNKCVYGGQLVDATQVTTPSWIDRLMPRFGQPLR
eukprot:GHVU01131993.1.p2 GENE.GHVU01131993.1~~GHVU01131993.1.p2  ORF type:complete len:124 (-),score=16.45 GHVU01131993.1:977-1348(-)